MEANMTTLFGGAAIFTTIAMVWNQIKYFLSRLFNLFVVQVKLEDKIPLALSIYLRENFTRLKCQPLKFRSFRSFVKSIKRRWLIAYEEIDLSSRTVFFNGWKPLVISRSSSGGDSSKTQNSGGGESSLIVSFIRGTFDPEDIIIKSMELLNERNQKSSRSDRFYVRRHFGRAHFRTEEGKLLSSGDSPVERAEDTELFVGNKRFLKYSVDDMGEENEGDKKLKILAFPKEMDDLIEEIRRWKESENWYKEKSIPWKRGWLLFCSPGKGKSSLTKAIGQYLDFPINIFDI